VIALVDFPRERIEHTVFVGLMMATMVSLYHRAHPIAPANAKKIFFLASATLVAVAALVAGSYRAAAEVHTVAALQARAAQDWPRVIAEIDRAESFFAPMDNTATPLAWYRGVAHFSMNDMSAALRDFQRAYEIHPHHLHVLNNLATCHELQGEHEQAIFFYKKALAISPRFEESLINLSAVYYNLQAYRAAHETLARCDPNSANPKIPEYLAAITSKLTKGDSL
jgi:tetratricopeptide (TPR) repeat protein